ncbi:MULTISPECIES: hypothetical protein [unclassified Corallococcus]|uniref:hypothetical protein n=1 Tax=unclassified Corallococcus TaxID=2685029 RepID=UPI001A8CFB92|nr:MULTISPECIES: hypothetical protein [unclassified Corallococcus]MBN9681328.1 hypothetical protein [Corallococcus sp. NCSPR001]WAS87091.1 hypothetical protein O0N60_08950 [Corallococcus sp. NCRR]
MATRGALLSLVLMGAPVAGASEWTQNVPPAGDVSSATRDEPPPTPDTAAPQAGDVLAPLDEPREADAPASPASTSERPPSSAPEPPPPPLKPTVLDAPLLDADPPPPAVPPRPLRPFIPHGEPYTEAPLSGGTWAAHGGVTLLPLGTVWAATRVGGDTRLGATAAEAAAGTVLASLPGRFLFVHPSYPQGRWMELEVGAFGAAMVVTPPVAALGTWGMGEIAFGDSEDRGHAYLGALGGATVGMLLGLAAHEGLRHLAGSSERLSFLREYLAYSLIGSGATVGYQWSRTPTPRR